MNTRWKPNVTVAALIEQDGKFLLVEEQTTEGLRLNNPAGHLDHGESLIEACAREALEETTHLFRPTELVGVYMSRVKGTGQNAAAAQDVTYLRFAFSGELGLAQANRQLDTGIVRTLWMTPAEVRSSVARHRSPMLVRCMEDYLAGQRYPLALIHSDASIAR